MRFGRNIVVTAAVAALALVGAGCGGGGDDGGSSAKVDVAKARDLFKGKCANCHAFADAEANGTFGPNLDEMAPSADTVKRQIETGGGGMPADLVKGKEAQLVADYVEQNAAH
jgi:cytochrome c551